MQAGVNTDTLMVVKWEEQNRKTETEREMGQPCLLLLDRPDIAGTGSADTDIKEPFNLLYNNNADLAGRL